MPTFLRIYDFRYFDSEGTPRFLPNTTAWHKSERINQDIAIHINRHGFRGPEPLERPSSRIITIGDSTVFNGGVELENSFPALTEAALREATGDSRVEVLNFAVGDTNIRHHYLKLKNHALSFNPDLVLVFIYLNDSVDSLASSADATTRSATTPWYHSFALEQLSRLLRNAAILLRAARSGRFDWVKDFQTGEYLNDPLAWERMRKAAEHDWGAAWLPDSWRATEVWVSEILKLTGQKRVETWLVVVPVAPQVQSSSDHPDLFLPQKLAREMAERQRVTLMDPLVYFRAHPDKDRLFYDQCHFTVLGNKAMSEFLLTRLQEWSRSRSR